MINTRIYDAFDNRIATVADDMYDLAFKKITIKADAVS